MDIITLKIKNKRKLNHFLNFIKDLDFIEVVDNNDNNVVSNKESSEDDFFALAGIWQNRDITADELRSKAWPKKN